MNTVPSFDPTEFAAATNTDSTKLMDLVGFELFGAKCGLEAGSLSNGKKFFYKEYANGYVVAIMPTARLVKENRTELMNNFNSSQNGQKISPHNVCCGYTKGYELLTIPADKLPLWSTLPFQVEGFSDERGKRTLPVVNPAAAVNF